MTGFNGEVADNCHRSCNLEITFLGPFSKLGMGGGKANYINQNTAVLPFDDMD